VRGVRLHTARLDDVAADLDITATCLTRGENNLLYEFTVAAAGKPLLEGRAAVMLNAAAFVSRAQAQAIRPGMAS
jgi:predicted hotdog family 3-hydroxylacyl-ACP dehydratase